MNRIGRPLPPEAVLPPCDERIVALYRYWLSIHPARGLLPAQGNFNPAEVSELLPSIWLADFTRHPLRFNYHVVGTGNVRAAASDAPQLEQVHPHFNSAYRQFVVAAAWAEVGFFQGAAADYGKNDWMSIQRLILPLATTGYDVDMLLGMTVCVPRLCAEAFRPHAAETEIYAS